MPMSKHLWGEDMMSLEEAQKLSRCPDCAGEGRIETPSRNFSHRWKICSRCEGCGYISKEPTKDE